MLDGKPYIFDAEPEFNNAMGKAAHSRFGVRGEKWDNYYVMSSMLKQVMADFGNFKKYYGLEREIAFLLAIALSTRDSAADIGFAIAVI